MPKSPFLKKNKPNKKTMDENRRKQKFAIINYYKKSFILIYIIYILLSEFKQRRQNMGKNHLNGDKRWEEWRQNVGKNSYPQIFPRFAVPLLATP